VERSRGSSLGQQRGISRSRTKAKQTWHQARRPGHDGVRAGRQRQDAGWTFLASDRGKIRVATIGRPHAGSAPQSPLSKLPLRSGFLARLTSTPLGPDDARQKAVSARAT
jgi:hypothetical protein